MTTADGACCPTGHKIDAARERAAADGRHETATQLAEALERHWRSTHARRITRKATLSERVAEANALSRKAANRW
ncbi:hypothetical protein ACFP1Z_16745 [Streptomyces gamaensis]|uniref:Uncharacterized protein n=1 Tax=Streptomyces gamaensis TaxID=1763542 RepID=A0ABW0Z214_9ACTN